MRKNRKKIKRKKIRDRVIDPGVRFLYFKAAYLYGQPFFLH